MKVLLIELLIVEVTAIINVLLCGVWAANPRLIPFKSQNFQQIKNKMQI